MNEDFVRNVTALWSKPEFRDAFLDFAAKAQKDGIEAARAFWSAQQKQNAAPENAINIFEQMMAFYSNLGLVTRQQHDEALKENERLKKENEFLRNTLRDLNSTILSEDSKRLQQAWKEAIDKQMAVSADLAREFVGFFRQKGEK